MAISPRPNQGIRRRKRFGPLDDSTNGHMIDSKNGISYVSRLRVSLYRALTIENFPTLDLSYSSVHQTRSPWLVSNQPCTRNNIPPSALILKIKPTLPTSLLITSNSFTQYVRPARLTGAVPPL